MFPPPPFLIRRSFAEAHAAGDLPVARARHEGQSDPVAAGQPCLALPPVPDCFSPSRRSGPFMAGPSLSRWDGQDDADFVIGKGNPFETLWFALESTAITTTNRGSIPCASRLSSSLFFPRPWPVACRTRRRAAWPARQLVRLSPMPWTKTCWPVPRSAGLQVSRPAASKSACRPATTRATEPLADRAAFGRTSLTRGTIRAARPGGPFSLRLMGGADV